MEITVVRSGGQLGRPFKLGPVDTADPVLDEEKRELIESTVRNCGFFDLPARIDDAHGVDTYQFEITVDDDGRRHAVSFDETSEEARDHGLREIVELSEALLGNDWEPATLGDGEEGTAGDTDRKLECDGWSAHLDGEDLHVKGHCRAHVAGVRVRLELGNEGIDDEPDLLVLELKVTWPELAREVMTTVNVNQAFRAQPDVKRVRIQGGADAEFEVEGAS